MVRDLVKKVMPAQVLQRLKPLLEASPLFMRVSELSSWRRVVTSCRPYQPNQPAQRVLILSCDPWTLVGSKGDEAMTLALIDKVRLECPGASICIVTASAAANEAAAKLGLSPLQCWTQPFSYSAIAASVREFRPDVVFTIGADVLDGNYSPVFSARLMLSTDICSRLGAKAAFVGFSFNPKGKSVKGVLHQLDPNIGFNLRDEVSLERFVAYSGRQAVLTADVAFLLRQTDQSPNIAPTVKWIKQMKSEGRVVIGFNIHPLLFYGRSEINFGAVVELLQEELRSVLASGNTSVLLICHDVRQEVGDEAFLGPLSAFFRSSGDENVEATPKDLTAAEIKELMGHVDCVVAARMHLAIAALGRGVPIAAITYQGKFQGLFRHFGLDMTYTVSPTEALEVGRLRQLILSLVVAREDLQGAVREALPSVLQRSRSNLAVLDVDASGLGEVA